MRAWLFWVGMALIFLGWVNPATVIAAVLLFLICFSRTEVR